MGTCLTVPTLGLRGFVGGLAVIGLLTLASASHAADPNCGKTVMGQKISCVSNLPLTTQAPPATSPSTGMGNGGVGGTLARNRAYNQCLAKHRVGVTISLEDSQKCWRLTKG